MTGLIVALAVLYAMVGFMVAAKAATKFETWSSDSGPGPLFAFIGWPILVIGMGLWTIFR